MIKANELLILMPQSFVHMNPCRQIILLHITMVDNDIYLYWSNFDFNLAQLKRNHAFLYSRLNRCYSRVHSMSLAVTDNSIVSDRLAVSVRRSENSFSTKVHDGNKKADVCIYTQIGAFFQLTLLFENKGKKFIKCSKKKVVMRFIQSCEKEISFNRQKTLNFSRFGLFTPVDLCRKRQWHQPDTQQSDIN